MTSGRSAERQIARIIHVRKPNIEEMLDMEYKTIGYEIRDGAAIITLNRPQRLNALTVELVQELHRALRYTASLPDVRALLLTGAGRGFCAGADLVEPRSHDPEDPWDLLRDLCNPACQLLKNLKIPTVAAVNGPAVGAGMSLALSCDIVIAGRSSYFLSGFTSVGSCPDAGASWLLPNVLGSARATGMMLLDERLSAEAAANWGLIWKCVDDSKLIDEAQAIVKKLAFGATLAYARTRELIRAAAQSSLPAQLILEAEYQTQLKASDDSREARKAFAEKRPPNFTGK